jgi:hypothetical protein
MSTERTKPDVPVALTPAPRGYSAWIDGVIARAPADLRAEQLEASLLPSIAGIEAQIAEPRSTPTPVKDKRTKRTSL